MLVLFAVAVCAFGDADAELALNKTLSNGYALQVGLMGGLALLAHLAVRRWAAYVVVGGVIGLIPETGKALPFLAKGGSSMLANWIMVALMLKLSDAAGRTGVQPAPDPSETLTISAEEIALARADLEL